jgi:hypothetical protein
MSELAGQTYGIPFAPPPVPINWPPKRWYPGIRAYAYAAGVLVVCPECGEHVAACNPRFWTIANGPVPQWAHQVDGEPLCPVVASVNGGSGYVPALPVTEHAFRASQGDDDAAGGVISHG